MTWKDYWVGCASSGASRTHARGKTFVPILCH